MTMRLAAIVAFVLGVIGVGVVYLASWLVNVLASSPSIIGFVIWCLLTSLGFFIVIAGLLTFYVAYVDHRRKGRKPL